jgi:hypothetical protein
MDLKKNYIYACTVVQSKSEAEKYIEDFLKPACTVVQSKSEAEKYIYRGFFEATNYFHWKSRKKKVVQP